MKKNIVVFCSIIFIFLPLHSEYFRVAHCTHLSIDANSAQSQTARIGYNDAVVVVLKKDTQFLRGIELQIVQPAAALNFPHSIACALYSETKNSLVAVKRDIRAEPLFTTILPEKKIFTVQIPCRKQHGLKKNPYVNHICAIQNLDRDGIVLRFSPVMKGLPDEFSTMKYSVKITPILTNTGGITVNLRHQKQAPPRGMRINLDSKNIEANDQPFIVPVGMHHLNITSENYRTEVRNFSVEKAKITTIDIALRSKIPNLLVSVPKGINIFLDGKKFTPKTDPQDISIGDHHLIFQIGSYKLERSFSAKEGKSYNVNLNLDVDLREED